MYVSTFRIEPKTENLPYKHRVAKILLADSDLASRLAIKSLLITAGYEVDGAASLAEAVHRLDSGAYQLVLADLRAESEDAGDRLVAYARQKDFQPATALISSKLSEIARESPDAENGSANRVVRISNDNVSYLLAKVAELIGSRADRRIRRSLLRAS